MSFDNTKYEIELNGVGYRIDGYSKSVLNDFVPRVGTGSQKETDFTLLRSKSLLGFEAGQLQRHWLEDNAFYGSEGLYPIYDDGVLYPVNTVVSAAGLLGASNKSKATASVTDQNYIWIASRTYNTPTNRIVRVSASGTQTVMTLPTSLTNSTAITSMVVWNDQVHIATGSNGHWWFSLSSTTVNEITTGSGYFTHLVVYRGELYGSAGSSLNHALYRYTGDTSSRSSVIVGLTGQYDASVANLFVFNGRIYLSRKEGLYAYDGITLNLIEDQTKNISTDNYKFPRMLKGFLYYFMPDGFYRTNGATIEKLYDKTEIGSPVDVTVGKNRLWFIYMNSNTSGSSRFDRLMGYDYSSSNNVDGRVVVFNGRGLYTYARTTTFVKNPGTEDFADQGAISDVFWFADKLYITTNYEKTTINAYFTIDTNELAASGQKSWRLITSIFDGDFAMVNKALENYELVLDGDVSLIDPTDSVDVSVSNTDFDLGGSWELVGDFFASTDYKINLHDQKPDGYSFKLMQTMLEGTTTAGYGIKQLITRYTVTPEIKWQWQLTLNCFGDSATEPLLLADGTSSTQTVRLLRGNVYEAAVSTFPINFIDIDMLELDTSINSAVLSIVLTESKLLKATNGFIQIDDEIIYWDGKSGDTITAVKRGALGTTAASHTADAKVFILYRVELEIRTERIIIDRAGSPAPEKARPSEIVVVLKEV